MTGWKRWTVLAALMATGGCYVYEPVRPADAVLDARVRATVSATKAAELEPALRNISTQLHGTLTERDGTGVLLEVPLYDPTVGTSGTALKNRIHISFDDLVTLESRSLSKWRTGAVVGALVAGITTTWVVVGGGDKTGDKEKPGVDNNVVIRIPLRFGLW